MPLVMIVAVPLLPLCCLGLVLWLGRLEDTLERDIRRRQDAAEWRAVQRRTAQSSGSHTRLHWSHRSTPEPASR